MNYFVVSPKTVSEKNILSAGRKMNNDAYDILAAASKHGRYIGRALYGHNQYFECPVSPKRYRKVNPDDDMLLALLLFKTGVFQANSTVKYYNGGGHLCGEKSTYVGPALMRIIKDNEKNLDKNTYYMEWKTPFGEYLTPVIHID